jgi:predicted acylesterase/phospholipase RssA
MFKKPIFLKIFIIFFILPFCLMAEEYSKEITFESGKLVFKESANLPPKPKIGLVLSGGGSRGFSHIGVLQVLDSLGIEVNLITGTSIGSVVGGLYCAGFSANEIEDITYSIDWTEIFTDNPQRTTLFLGQKTEQDRYLLSLRLVNFKPYIPNAVTPGQKVLNILSDLFLFARYQPKNSFDDLKIPFRSVATDIVSGKMIVLKDGNIAEAINGSLAVPLLFSPVSRDNMLLVDGGIKANLPVSVAQDEKMDIIIASDVSATLRKKEQIQAPWEVADQVTTIMTDRNNIKEYKNVDILILPKIPAITGTDFSKIDTMIMAGKKAALQKVAEIKETLKKWREKNDKIIDVSKINYNVDGQILNSFIDYNQSIRGSREVSLITLSDSIDHALSKGEYQKVTAFTDTTEDEIKIKLLPFGIVDSVAITGNNKLSYKVLTDSLKTLKGNRLNAFLLQQDLSGMVDIYRSEGYALMEITGVKLDKKTGILSISIDEGMIRSISVEGNVKTEDYIILREFALQNNDAFNWISVKRGIDNVYASSLFNRVSVDVDRDGQQANVVIKVDERPSVQFKMGGKGDIERRFQAYLELADENFLGQGMKTKAQMLLGVRDGLLGFNFRNDRIFTSYVTFAAESYFSWEVNPINPDSKNDGRYREERLGIKLQMGQQIARIGQLVGEIRIEQVKDFQQSGSFSHAQELQLRSFALRSITDKRDRIDFPTRGIYNHWAWENGNSFILQSEESYTKVLINLEGYYSTFEDQVAHVRFFGGFADETLPFSENFRVGGLHDFYGLLDNELFGKQVVIFNFEYRYKLPFQILTDTYISGRYDLGSVWENPNLVINGDDFFTGLGGYLGMDTFLGPLYIGFGKSSLGRSTFYLSMGFAY